jgi:inorganic triphosphatase YgiF
VSTEIEAKFIVPDGKTFEALKTTSVLASFSLTPGRLFSVHDRYLDTPGGALRAAGYACRRREQEGGIIMTLKAIRTSSDPLAAAIHRRQELEVHLPADAPPALWPPGEARETALAVVRGEPLEALVDIRQERFLREVFDGERRVAALSLDIVEAARGDGLERVLELEIELSPEGTEADLAGLAGWVSSHYRLLPSLQSKLERALALREPEGFSPGGAGPAARRVRAAHPREETITLAAPEGLTREALLGELAAMGYRSRVRASREVSEVFFDSHDGALLRKGYLLAHSLDDGRWRLRKGERVEAEQEHDGESVPAAGDVPDEISRLTGARVKIPFLKGSLRETEYWLHGTTARPLRLVLGAWSLVSPVHEAGPREVLLVSARGSPLATSLPYLLTLLRERFQCREPQGTLLEQGLARLGLPVPGARIPDRFVVSAQDAVPGACRKILAGEAWRMRASLAGARGDLDIEYVHLLRVATRRARFAVRLFAALFPAEAEQGLRAELAWIAGLLGTVRDLDVMLDGLGRQVALLDAPAGFQEAVRAQLLLRRAPAHDALAAALGSERFTGLLALLESPPGAVAGEGTMNVRRFAEGRVGKAMARLGHWTGRPASGLVDADLHRLRILFKRLRYTCEFFRPLFPRELGELVNACISFQDCLGALQDAAVASAILQDLAANAALGASPGFLMSLGALVQLQRDTRQVKRGEFLERWGSVGQLSAQWQSIRGMREKSR